MIYSGNGNRIRKTSNKKVFSSWKSDPNVDNITYHGHFQIVQSPLQESTSIYRKVRITWIQDENEYNKLQYSECCAALTIAVLKNRTNITVQSTMINNQVWENFEKVGHKTKTSSAHWHCSWN